MAKMVRTRNPRKVFLWVLYAGRVYIEPGGIDTHMQWFESLGLPTSGSEFDRAKRGYVYVEPDKVVFEGSDRFPPEEVIRKFFALYPQYRGREVNPARLKLIWEEKQVIWDAVGKYLRRGFHDWEIAFNDWTYHRELEFGFDDAADHRRRAWRKGQVARKALWREYWRSR